MAKTSANADEREWAESNAATRRVVLRAAGATSAVGVVSALFATGAAAKDVTPEPVKIKEKRKRPFRIQREAAESVFPQSVASGGPTRSGVIAWTRIDPEAYDEKTPLGVEVATDDAFEDVVYRGVVPASEIDAAYDYTVNADLDGELESDTEYAYRFVYDGNSSQVGHCRTLPEPDASPGEVSFAVLSCNNYLDGYFGGFAHVADEDVDFLVHLGDFIYEYAGEGQQPGRGITLPSGEDVAFGLEDFRHLHGVYRSEGFMQRALEEHTLIHTWDDHEIVNNRWWNYELKAPDTESHPRGDEPDFMRRLYVEGIKAMTEYVPARVGYEPASEDGLDEAAIQEDFTLYRSIRFGDL